ncbi:MAG: hypothetical protein NXI16_02085 [Alphaproteobacteria bacterium]|nr:hypothetical protein [Alphaproteobacteria bacterium]
MAVEKGLHIVFGEADGSIGQAMRDTLRDAGYGGFRTVVSPDNMPDALGETLPDLVIADIKFLGSPAGKLVREVRSGKIGDNPYIPIIVMIFEHDAHFLKAMVDSGVDDVLVKPAAPATLLAKVKMMAERRKPFVVTSEYIGPDRRKGSRADEANPIPRFEVPNTLGDKVKGRPVDEQALKKAIQATRGQINDERLRRNGFQIGFLARQVVPALRGEVEEPQLRGMLKRLILTCDDIAARVVGTPFETSKPVSVALRKVAAEIHETISREGDWPNAKAINLLNELGYAVPAAFNPEKGEEALAAEIGSAINSFQKKRASQAAG